MARPKSLMADASGLWSYPINSAVIPAKAGIHGRAAQHFEGGAIACPNIGFYLRGVTVVGRIGTAA